MAYINLDGHKDRDCHWYIEQKWSYGDRPYFQALHWGYIGKDFTGSKCDTLQEAQEELRDALVMELHRAKVWLRREITTYEKNPDSIYWGSTKEYKDMLQLLESN